MEYFDRHELKKINPASDEYEIVIHLNGTYAEFANELGTAEAPKGDLLSSVKQLVNNKYPNLKVTVAKIVVGGMAITTLPLAGANISKAEELSKTEMKPKASEVADANSIYYSVSPGDTLWDISRKYNTTVDDIKKANQLTSNIIQINQKLIIPKAFHTVGVKDYLTVLAKEYGTTVGAIKEANGLTSDETFLGQTLIIPATIDGQPTVPTMPATIDTTPAQTNSYTVVSGDSLSVIAKRFGTSVEALRSANHLTSDLIRVGQVLTIPSSSTTANPQASTPAPNAKTTTVSNTNNTSYTVKSGDALWSIAQRYNVSVDQIKQANHLTGDMIFIGQVLIIPAAQSSTPTASTTQAQTANTTPTQTADPNVVKTQESLKALGYYAVTTMTGNYDAPTKQAISNFQADYGLPVTGTVDAATSTAVEHAVVKKSLVSDTGSYLGVPYLWGGTTPKGFDCSGFVYYMFNQHGVNMGRNTSAGLYKTGTAISKAKLQPGDLVFFAVNSTGTISHVGFYMGNNQFISATSSKGIAIYSINDSYWSKYYVGAKRVY